MSSGPRIPCSKNSKKAFFTYLPNESSFQQGFLGTGKQSVIAGVLSLRYSDGKPIFAKKAQVSFIGKEYVHFTGKLEKGQENDNDDGGDDDEYHDDDATTISSHSAKRKFFQASICLWRSQHKGHYEGVKTLDLPFKLKLPDNLPPSVCMDKGYGRLYYILKAKVSRQPINPDSHNRNKVIRVVVPIARFTLTLPALTSRWLVKDEGPAIPHAVGYDISLSNSIFKPNSKVVIPVKLYFHEPHIYLKDIMAGLKECHELRTNKYETLISNYLTQKTVTSDSLPTSPGLDNEHYIEISLDIPPERQLVYTVDSTYLTVSHKIEVKISLGGAPDISLSKIVKIENIVSEDELNSSLLIEAETPEIIQSSRLSKYSNKTSNRISPYLPTILNKFHALDPITKKRISMQLQFHIADSKNPNLIYNSRSILLS